MTINNDNNYFKIRYAFDNSSKSKILLSKYMYIYVYS